MLCAVKEQNNSELFANCRYIVEKFLNFGDPIIALRVATETGT